MKEVHFFAGVHGVGKSTLCRVIFDKLGIPNYSASAIIKENTDYIEESKYVSDAAKNQLALIRGLNTITEDKYLLDGHFCLWNKKQNIIDLDYSVFDAMHLKDVILVTAKPEVIFERMMQRDGKSASIDQISALQEREIFCARDFCSSRNIPLVVFESGSDTSSVIGLM